MGTGHARGTAPAPLPVPCCGSRTLGRGSGARGRALGAGRSLGGGGEELRSPKRSPRGERRALRPSKHHQRRGRGYLQVRADSPQDVVDAVAGDEGHEDVLRERERERSCQETFPPTPSRLLHRQGTGRRHPALESLLLQELCPPRRHLPAELPCCYFCSLLKPGPDFFGASFARLLFPRGLPCSAQRDAAANGAGSDGKHPHASARGDAGQRSPCPTQSPRDAQSGLATRSL